MIENDQESDSYYQGRLEKFARNFYAYDFPNEAPFDEADPDLLAPYYDLAEIALRIADEATSLTAHRLSVDPLPCLMNGCKANAVLGGWCEEHQ